MTPIITTPAHAVLALTMGLALLTASNAAWPQIAMQAQDQLNREQAIAASDQCRGLIEAGRWAEARSTCAKAVVLDSSASSIANLGHTYLLAGSSGDAYRWYRKSVTRFKDRKEMEDGPLADFALFTTKGWQVELADQARRWFEDAFVAIAEVRSLNAEVIKLDHAKRYEEAIPKASRALSLTEQWLTPQDAQVAVLLSNLALQFQNTGRLEQALPLYQRALAVNEQAQGPEHPSTRDSLNTLAAIFRAMKRYDQALPLYQRALAISEKSEGPEHPSTGTQLSSLAGLYWAMDRYDQALPLYQRSLAISENSDGPAHPITGNRLNNLAGLYQAMGRYEQALPLAQRALAISESVNGLIHPDTVGRLARLATLYRDMGLYTQALPLAQRALAASEKSNDIEPSVTAWRLNDVAMLFMLLGQYGQALPLAQRALVVSENTSGPDAAETASLMVNVARLYKEIGQFEQSLALHERALVIIKKVYGHDHPDHIVALSNIGALFEARGQYAESLRFAEQALEIGEKVYGPEHPKTALLLNNLGWARHRMGQAAQALPLLHRSLTISEKTYGPEHALTGVALTNLAVLYLDDGERSRALGLYQRALQIAAVQQDPRVRFNILRIYAPHEFAHGNKDVAIFYAKQAVNTFQSIRSSSQDLNAEWQGNLLESNKQIYQELATWLVEGGRFVEAEQVVAMLKDRELFELTREAAVAVRQSAVLTGAEIKLDREYRALQGTGIAQANELESLRRLDDQGVKLSAEQEARRAQLLKDQERWQKDFERFMASVQPTLSRDTQAAGEQRQRVEASSTALMGYIRDSNDKSTLRHAALSYVVTEDSVSVIVTTAEGATARQTPLKKGELNARVAQLRQVLQNPKLDPRPAAQALYKILLTPIEQELATLAPQVLVLNLTDTLRYIPFAALYDGQQYLMQRYALALYPSAGFRGVQTQAAAGWQVAGLGLTQARKIEDLSFPALQSVAGELGAIVRDDTHPQGALPGQAQMDAQFTRRAFEQALARARQGKASVLHVASHFHLAPGNDYGSYLVVGEAEPLRLSAIRSMNFNGVDMLTLSACNTASQGGRNENGSEIEGLGAIAQSSGARSVMATLWPVADTSTAALMQRFYQVRTQGKEREMTNAQAIRLAQLALLEGTVKVEPQPAPPPVEQGAPPAIVIQRAAVPNIAPQGVTLADAPEFVRQRQAPYAHPFYWAPFVLMGNWL